MTIALLALSLVLAACRGDTTTNLPAAWTTADVSQIFDLSELGSSLTVDAETSTLLLDGRPLPADVLAAFPYLTMGRSHNLLRLSQDVLDAMDGGARLALLHATASELHAHLAEFGLSVADVQGAWGSDGELTLTTLRRIAEQLDSQTGVGIAADRGQRLLETLGINR
jgi:hypothetical protein